MIGRLLAEFQAGRRIYIPGASGEILPLAAALADDPGRMDGVHLTSCFLPGLNGFDYAALHPRARVATFLLPPTFQTSFAAGRVDVLPLDYLGVAAYLGATTFDTVIAHVAPPNQQGRCSLGIAADFTSIIWPSARRKIAVVNEAMPAMRRGPSLRLADADLVVPINAPLAVAPRAKTGAEAQEIAKIVAGLVPDGAAIQLGIGGVPGAVWNELSQHRRLTIASGMVTDGLRGLAKAGALATEGSHHAGVAFGTAPFYQYLADSDLVAFKSVPETHGLAAIRAFDHFVSVNGALEVDLFGQVNMEWRGEQLMSGVGGAPNFIRGAAAARDGLSIIALPSTAQNRTLPRIVPKLLCPTVSIPRNDVDCIVTEHGVARLRGRNLESRAQALIAIAAPTHRDALADAWAALRRRL